MGDMFRPDALRATVARQYDLCVRRWQFRRQISTFTRPYQMDLRSDLQSNQGRPSDITRLK